MNERKTSKKASAVVVLVGSIVLAIGGVGVVRNAGSETPEQEKLAIIERLEATRQAAIQFANEHPEELPPMNPTLMPTVEPTSWSVGLIEDAYLPGGGFTVSNMWSWDLSGNHVQVFAGSAGPNVSEVGRGALFVMVTSMDLQPLGDLSGYYKVPVGMGALWITSFEGTVLTIEAENGETFYFDADTRAFTDVNGDPVPTDTPTPTPWPDPTLPPVTLPPPSTETVVPVPSAVADN